MVLQVTRTVTFFLVPYSLLKFPSACSLALMACTTSRALALSSQNENVIGGNVSFFLSVSLATSLSAWDTGTEMKIAAEVLAARTLVGHLPLAGLQSSQEKNYGNLGRAQRCKGKCSSPNDRKSETQGFM